MSQNKKPAIQRQKIQLSSTSARINRVGRDEKAPDFVSLLDPSRHPNPLDGLPALDIDTPLTESQITSTADGEMSETLKAIIAAKKERRDAYRTSTNPNYYYVLVFQNDLQLDQFLETTKWHKTGASNDRYGDGLAIAGKLGIDIAPINLPRQQAKAAPRALRGRPVIE